MDKVKRRRPKQAWRPDLREVEWTKEAIEAALSCMYSPKTTRAQKIYSINMKDALNAAMREQFGKND